MAAAVVLLVLLSGCSWIPWFNSKHEGPPDQLAYDGMDLYQRGKYRSALETFQHLADWYPLSRYAILAELKAADCHFNLEEYEEAIIKYQEFESLHPRNEAVPYVIYQIGLSYFHQMDTVDRDQSVTRNALDTFLKLRQEYPDSPYANKAENEIGKCYENLAGHDLYVGKFYYKSKHYSAAVYRLTKVLTDYPDVGYNEEAREYIDRCESKVAELLGE